MKGEIINNWLIDHKFIETDLESKFQTLGLVNSINPETLTFIDDPKFVNEVSKNANITGCFVTKEIFENFCSDLNSNVVFVSEDPRYDFYSLLNYLGKKVKALSNKKTIIGENTKINPTAFISESNVIIGSNCLIDANVSILDDVIIGDNVVISAGSVIGCEGFEHKRTSKGILSVMHDGLVIIGNDIVIGALNSIAKGFHYRNTMIGDETKTDSLVHIAHGVQIGKRCFLPASGMIAGSSTIGDDVWIGPNSSISSQIKIGNEAFITIGSVVTRDINPKTRVTGNFAIDHNIFINNLKKSLK